jgi:hypothetical protein
VRRLRAVSDWLSDAARSKRSHRRCERAAAREHDHPTSSNSPNSGPTKSGDQRRVQCTGFAPRLGHAPVASDAARLGEPPRSSTLRNWGFTPSQRPCILCGYAQKTEGQCAALLRSLCSSF